MRLYLMQHGHAKSKEEDPDRPLTEQGRTEVEWVASFLARGAEGRRVRVLHSGKSRARETAELLAASLDEATVEETDGLAPMDDPQVWGHRAGALDEGAVLVGHLPHLARLASLLLSGDPDRDLVAFSNGGLVCLDRRDDGGWTLRWSVIPSLLE